MRTFLTWDEVQRLIEAGGSKRNRLLLRLLAYTGIRVSELCALRVKDCDLKGCQILIPHLKSRRKGKKRIVDIDTKTARLIQEYIEECKLPPEGRLFDINRFRAYAIVRQAARRAGLEGQILTHPSSGKGHYVSPHRLRDAFAMRWLQHDDSFDSAELLQEALGHSSLDTTRRYVKLGRERRRKAYRQIFSD
mgnify:CR=1 FL=1